MALGDTYSRGANSLCIVFRYFVTSNQQAAMILKAKDQLERLHPLIESGSTGSPAELAQRLGVTDRTVRNYISQLVKPSSLTLS